jgi:cold shock CspA family protein
VRVVEVRGLDSTCWFIDHGDTEVVPAEDLREMAPKFLDLPPQAVTMQLAGLEDYEYSEAVLDHLNSLLLGKSLVAKVENRQLLGSHYLKSSKSVPRLVLFDTSSEDVDVNLNQKLLELLVSQDSQSKLPPAGGEEVSVLISHIDKNGDIYVQKESSAFTMVEKLIVELGDTAMSSAPAVALLPDQLYLVKYNEDGGLYRAALLPDQVDGDTAQVFFVDYGNSSAVSKADIWELASLPEPLVQELARQALRCRLAGAPPPGHSWSEQATTALRELVPEGQTVRLRVTGVASDSVSLVEVHLPDSKDGSVNFDLSTELELFALSPSSQPPSPAKTSGPVSPAAPPLPVAPAILPVLAAPPAPPALLAAPPVLVTNGTTGPVVAVEAERPMAQYRPPALGSAFLLIPPTPSMSEGERAGQEKAWTGTVTTVNAEKKLGFLTPDKSLPAEYKGNSLFFHCNVVKNSLGRPVRLEHGSKVKFVLYKAKDGMPDNLERPKAFAVYVTDPMAAELEVRLPTLGSDLASMKTLLAPTIPAAGRYFDVNVTFAVSPSSFVVQPYNEVGRHRVGL